MIFSVVATFWCWLKKGCDRIEEDRPEAGGEELEWYEVGLEALRFINVLEKRVYVRMHLPLLEVRACEPLWIEVLPAV